LTEKLKDKKPVHLEMIKVARLFKSLNCPERRTIPPLAYLLFTVETGMGAGAFEAQAPRVRVAAAKATTAAILVMVMIEFRLLSVLVALRGTLRLRAVRTKKNHENFSSASFEPGFQSLI
jgi:hypothetical protein